MSKKNGRDYLYLIWKHPETRRRYIVGILSKNGQFEFEYGSEFEQAQKAGFKEIEAFKDPSKKYASEKLFPVFASRLPDRKRRGITDILKKYNLDEYDEYLLLKNSGARLPIDTFEFIDPIFDDEQPVYREFYIAGVRHYLPCSGEICNIDSISSNDILTLKMEPDNKYDENAVEIFDSANLKLGYVPRYYSKQVTKMIKNNKDIVCRIIEKDSSANCRECLKVSISIS